MREESLGWGDGEQPRDFTFIGDIVQGGVGKGMGVGAGTLH